MYTNRASAGNAGDCTLRDVGVVPCLVRVETMINIKQLYSSLSHSCSRPVALCA